MKNLWIVSMLALSGCLCGGTVTIDDPDAGRDAGRKDGGSDAGKPDGGKSDGGTADAGATCIEGESCGDGGVCAGGSCCAASLACGSQCCTSSTVCSFNSCVPPGAVCRDSSECATTEFCDFGGTQAPTVDAGNVCNGGALAPGRCLPRPPLCPPTDGGSPVGAGVTCIEACTFTAATQAFQPIVRYAWGGEIVSPFASDVMMAPIVTQLDDDDCDGKITANDIPEIVVVSFANGAYTSPGTVHALSVKQGALVEKWSRAGVINAGSQLASGNIDGVPGNEIVGCGNNGVVALRADGGDLWTTAANNCLQPSLADLEGDGTVEVITESQILNGKTGAIKHTLAIPAGVNTIADLNGDGMLDVITGSGAANGDGTELANAGIASSFVAVADLDRDGKPEVISVNSSNHTLTIWQYDATKTGKARIVRTGLDLNGPLAPSLCPAGSAGFVGGGGPPTVGDFNADGFPDVALAGGVGYSVLDGKKLMDLAVPAASTFLWTRPTRDCSSAATGSALFDFDGDGRAEAVYADEISLHIYESATGNDRYTTCNTSGTLIELPVIADVDNDGQADIVVVSNAYAFTCATSSDRFSGVRVFSAKDNNWVRTRRIWNQHAYSVVNIEEDGTVPTVMKTNWLQPGLNNFRQNKQPGAEFSASDAVATVVHACDQRGDLRVTVRNLGEAPLPPGTPVDVMKGVPGSGTLLTTVSTTRTLGPAQGESLRVPVTDLAVINGTTTVYVVVRPAASVRECRAGNNVSAVVTTSCIN